MSTVTTAPAPAGSAEVSATTFCEAFHATAAVEPDAVALRASDGSLELTWAQYAARVQTIAAGLHDLGVRRGDTVAILMGNRPEFNLVDTAAFHLGATPFSIYNTSSPEQIAHVFANSGAAVVVAELKYLERILAARGDGEQPSAIVLIDGEADGCLTLAELEARGAAASDFDFEATWRAVEPEDVLTLIYTSGTTGPSKGVELTHANMLAQCRAVASVLPVRRGATITSYLPHAHAADRWSSHYNGLVYGVSVTSISDAAALPKVLAELRPTVWGAVPRVLEKIKAALDAGIDADPDEARRTAVRGAIALGVKRVQLLQAGEPVPAELEAQYEVADARVLSALRAKLGLDRVEWLVVGAAPLPRHVQEFLMGIGLPVSELYGMSECSCCVTTCLPEDAKIGSVGKVLPGVEAKIADDGELLFRGPITMRGYRGQPEKTAEALDADGWIHTGDIGEIDADGYVRIVDRKKELIINAGGKNMSPLAIEGALKLGSPLIGQAAAIGDGRPYNVALLVLDPDAARGFAAKHGLAAGDLSALAADPTVQAEVSAGVERANERLSRVEQIKRWELLGDEWLPGGDELTPTMKLKRKPIAEKYADVIAALYA
jgi:long-subunit acyl-CoA synthetase (AMP-forming)